MNKFILVKGDVSGIQDFIFNVKSKGAARELKGRSFFIKLLVEVTMQYLFDKAGITNQQTIADYKISISGGNFIIKLPKGNGAIVNDAQKNFTEALQYTGLNISITYVDYDSSNYKQTIINLNAKTRERKLQFYPDIDFFEPKDKAKYTKGGWISVTDKVKDKSHFSIDQINTTSKILKIGQVELAGYKVNFGYNGTYVVGNYLESLFPLYIDNRNQKKIKLFSEGNRYEQMLSKSARIDYSNNCKVIENGGMKGADKLGVLAMDVDGLGNVIENIFKEGEHKVFDNKLRLFFNKELRNIINGVNTTYNVGYCQRNKIIKPLFKDKVYTVTAGGDDSFFVGKWNTMLALAIEIKKAFMTKFSKDGLTISAGIVIVDPKFPVIRFAEMAENALKKAKYDYDTKGNICLFGEVIKWHVLEKEIMPLRKHFTNALRGKFTKGKLQKARSILYNNIDKPIQLQDFWQMNYYLRDLSNRARQNILKIINVSIESSISQSDDFDKRNYRLITPIAARLAELDKR